MHKVTFDDAVLRSKLRNQLCGTIARMTTSTEGQAEEDSRAALDGLILRCREINETRA